MEWLFAIVFLAFPLTVSPGPANILFATMGAKFGWKLTLPLVWGINTSFIIISIFIGFSLKLFQELSPNILSICSFFGLIYLYYLAVKLYFSEFNNDQNSQQSAPGFMHGFIFQLLNPKAWFVNLSIFAIFGEKFDYSLLIINIILLLVRLLTQNIWVLSGVAIAKLFEHPETKKYLNISLSLSLIITATWMMIDLLWYS